MIEIKRRLNEREALRMTLMATMVRNKRDLIEEKNDMGRDSECELSFFLKDMGFSRGDFVSSVLSKYWASFIKDLQNTNLIPS